MNTNSTMTPVLPPTPAAARPSLRSSLLRRVSGFTLGELLLVLVIIGVLAVIAFRSVQPIIISGRVEATATDTNNAVQRIISAANSGAAGTAINYSGINTATFAPFLASSNMFRVNAGVITHRLSTGTAPLLTVASALTNAAIELTFAQVHDAACVDLASLLQTAAVIVTINGATAVKDSTAATAVPFNGVTAATQCRVGSTNALVFTFQ
jgi:prepilin-type N-terminal cleavage/methylation domain-containing protein